MTAWTPDQAEVAMLGGPYAARWRVGAWHPDLPDGGVGLEPTRVQLTWDEERAPRAQAVVDVKLPEDPVVAAALDGRQGTRLHIHYGVHIRGAWHECLLQDVGLRRRAGVDGQGILQLDASGDEALAMDNGPSSITSGAASTSSRGHVDTQLAAALQYTPEYVRTIPIDASFAVPNGGLGDKWSFLEDLVDGLDSDLWDDGTRLWQAHPRPVLETTPVLTLTDGEGGTIVARSSEVDRDAGWNNRVILVYRWEGGGPIQAVKSITSGPFSTSAAGIKAYQEQRDNYTTQARADAAAAALVKRMGSRGRRLTVRTGLVPWLRPGMTVRLATRNGTARHLVSRVTLDSAGWMEFGTRYPDSTETVGA